MPKRIIAILLALMLAVPAMALAEPEFPDEVYERYDSVETYWYSSQMGGPGGLFPVSKDERYGFINFAGEEVVPLIYDYTEGLSNGMGCVHKDGKIGFVNLSGEMVIPLEYDNSAYTINGDIFALLKGGKWGVVDITGTEHSLFIYDEIGSPSEGMVMVIQGDKMGFISTDGGADISVVYDAVYKSCGNCRQLVFTGGYAPVRLDGLWGFIRKNGTVTVPLIYDNAGDFGDGLAPVKKGDKWGYIDEAGSQKLPFVYDNAWNFSSGEAKVRLDGLLGYINKNGEKLRGFIFEDEADFSSRPDFLNGYILAKKDGKWGVVSSDYETVAVPFEYDEIEYDGTTTYAENLKVKLNDKYGFIDLENNTVFPIEISFFTIAGEGLQSYCRDGLWGYMDMYQNPAVEPAYDMAWPFKGGLAQVKTGEGWGFIDKAGRVIIEAKYNTVMDFSEGLAAAQNSGGKWGFIDRNGNTVVDFTLDGGGYFYGGVAKIKAGAPDYIQDSDLVYIIDRSGKLLTEPVPYGEYKNIEDFEFFEDIPYFPSYYLDMVPSQLYYDFKNFLTREECCFLMEFLYYQLTGKRLPYPDESTFADTDSVEVRQCYELGLISGVGNGLFMPDSPVTRQDFSVMASKLLMKLGFADSLEKGEPIAFSDMEAAAAYALDAIDLLSSLGIVQGWQGNFDPLSNITREHGSIITVKIHDLVIDHRSWRI